MKIGIDFGSTYTILSRYRKDQGVLQAMQDPGNNSSDIPSVVSLNERHKTVTVGSFAKDNTGKRGFRAFKAFKMLMMEKNQAFVKSRQYDEEYTPQWAANEFLRAIIDMSRSSFEEPEIEELVVGAPDVWFHNFETLGGRAVLRDICTSIDGIGNVRIISEPVLASAYFAYNFQKNSGKPFEGNILIIDYGGGTLDLSLTEIKKGNGDKVEVKMLESNGAGENTDHSVGNAGIVYMESLMEYVIRKSTPDVADQIIGTPKFYQAVNELEKALKFYADTIAKTFEYFGIDDLDLLEEEYMGDPITCGGEDYDVTFADMVEVYDQVIRPIFESKMNEMIRWAKEIHHIDVHKAFGDKFRIALVGGFGKFYLVKKQMREKFGFVDRDDKREEYIIKGDQDRECAISYGAALVASGTFDICNTAPYSVGICSTVDGRRIVDYSVQYLDEIKPNQPYYIKNPDGSDKVFQLLPGWADEFVIDYGRANPEQIRFRAKDKFQKELEGLVKNAFKACSIGISFSTSDVLSIHVREYDLFKGFTDIKSSKELGKLSDAFEEVKG